MTTLDNTVQHEAYKTRYGLYAAGNIGSSAPYKIKSARYIDTSANDDHPLRYGYGCGDNATAEGCVSQAITRTPAFVLAANIASNVLTIPYDLSLNTSDTSSANRIGSGDFIAIGDEVLYVRGIDNSNGNLQVVRGQKGSTAANHTAADPVYKLGGPSNFAGVIMRDKTRPGRVDNSAFVDAFLEGEIAPVMYDGDVVVGFTEAVVAADLNKPVSVIGSGSNQGLFMVGDEDASTILVPNSRIISTSEDQGSGNTPRYLAVVRFTG